MRQGRCFYAGRARGAGERFFQCILRCWRQRTFLARIEFLFSRRPDKNESGENGSGAFLWNCLYGCGCLRCGGQPACFPLNSFSALRGRNLSLAAGQLCPLVLADEAARLRRLSGTSRRCRTGAGVADHLDVEITGQKQLKCLSRTGAVAEPGQVWLLIQDVEITGQKQMKCLSGTGAVVEPGRVWSLI